MSTIHNAKKKLVVSAVGAAAVAATLPALLFLGAGTAQAKCVFNPQGGQNCFAVAWDPWVPFVGLTAHITNLSPDDFPQCTYASTPDPNQPQQGLPTYTSPSFHLPPEGTYNLLISSDDFLPVVPTGTNWNITVDCGPGYIGYFQHTF